MPYLSRTGAGTGAGDKGMNETISTRDTAGGQIDASPTARLGLGRRMYSHCSGLRSTDRLPMCAGGELGSIGTTELWWRKFILIIIYFTGDLNASKTLL